MGHAVVTGAVAHHSSFGARAAPGSCLPAHSRVCHRPLSPSPVASLCGRPRHAPVPTVPSQITLKNLRSGPSRAQLQRRSCCRLLTRAGWGPSGEGGRVLVTFDVDGTLVHSIGEEANKMHKQAFSYAFKEVFGVDGTIDAIKVGPSKAHHGSTDKLVAVNTLAFYGVPKHESEARIDEITGKMLEYAFNHTNNSNAAEGLELLPGVLDLLTTLKSLHPEVCVGLVTGNLEDIAWLKMSGLGILDLFSQPHFGGFGSDHVDRGELVRIAASRAAERIPGPPFRLRVHVGDTPNDILAAQHGNARPLGLCTGIFSREELEAAINRDDAVILDSLENTEEVLKFCNLSLL